jgi:uncharacterized delta-60 repeat protein
MFQNTVNGKSRLLSFLCLCVLAADIVAEEPPVQKWVARYDGPTAHDFSRVLVVDALGNIYITGESLAKEADNYDCYDFVTIKYDPNGNQLWMSRYDEPDTGSSGTVRALAIDGFGNVYVAGDRCKNGNYDYTTVKYDSIGNQLWADSYNGTGNGPDFVRALAVDDLGNVYVTGYSEGSGTFRDYATIKYDPNGNQLWVSRYTNSAYDEAYAIVVDGSGNVYVTGESAYDYATIKYDTNGSQLWVARYSGPGYNTDCASSLFVDNLGNTYVTGYSSNGSNSDYATVKYDMNGNQLWVARYNGPGDNRDYAHDLSVDTLGNVYITGYSYGSGTSYDYATIKYDSNGNQLWVARYSGPEDKWDIAYALALDSLGNVCVTGRSYNGETGYDYVTIKYDTNGNQLWIKRYDGPISDYDRAYDIAIDHEGNICVTGSSKDAESSDDYATIKYDSTGNQLWIARYNGTVSGEQHVSASTIDRFGNIYVTGQSGTAQSCDIATIKYDSSGNQSWVKYYNGPDNYAESVSSITTDKFGSVYITGDIVHSSRPDVYSSGRGGVTVKYDTNGNRLWVVYNNGPQYGEDIAVDDSGDVYVTGRSWDSSGGSYNYATAKYDPNGNLLWMRYYNGPGNGFDFAYDLAVDSTGNVYVTGYSEGSGTICDYSTIKYDTNGNQLWVARSNYGSMYGYTPELRIDNCGGVYIAGPSYNGINLDYATIKYDPNGNQLWDARYNGLGNKNDLPYNLEIDNFGNTYVTGSSEDGNGWSDYLTIKYDSNGNQLWVARYNGPGEKWDVAHALAVDIAGNVYVTGNSEGNDVNMTNDNATVKYDPNGKELWVVRYHYGYGMLYYYDSFLALDSLGSIYVTHTNSYDYAMIKYTQHNYCISPIEGDHDENCKIDFLDFEILAQDWLEGFNFSDLAVLAEGWLECNFALEEDCR